MKLIVPFDQTSLKRFIVEFGVGFLFAIILSTFLSTAWAEEKDKDKFQWKLRALLAEFNFKQQQLPEFFALQEFAKEVDGKGYMIKDGMVVEKPKPMSVPEKKEESKK